MAIGKLLGSLAVYDWDMIQHMLTQNQAEPYIMVSTHVYRLDMTHSGENDGGGQWHRANGHWARGTWLCNCKGRGTGN